MHIQTMHFDFCRCRIEVLELQLTNRTAVHGVRKIATEGFDVKMIRSLADLFVRRKAYPHLAMLDLRMLYQILHRRYDLSDTGFVVRTEQRRCVCYNHVLTGITRINIIALFGLHNRGFDMLTAGIRRSVHMRDETDYR